METQRPQTAKTILTKNKVGDIPLWFQTILQSYSNQNSVVQYERHTDQWNRIESARIIVNLWQWRQEYTSAKDDFFNSVRKTRQLHVKESNWTTFSHHIYKLKMD